LTGGHDRTVRLWNPFRVDPGFTFSGDNSMLCSQHEPRSVAFNELPPALPIQTYSLGYTHPISALCTTESNSAQILLASSDKTLIVTDLVTNRVIRRFQGHAGRINAVAAAQRGEAFLTASYDGTVSIWDGRSRDTRPMQIFREAKDSVTDVHTVQSEGGQKAAAEMGVIRTASLDGVVRSYDLRKGLLKCDDCGCAITNMARTHDGQCLVISCLDGTIRLIELDTGELLNTYSGFHKSGQYGLEVAMLADDATIATGSEDGACILYDLVRASRVQALEGPTRPTCSIAAHPKQSNVIITASYDGSTTVWSNDSFAWRKQMLGD
jgi:mitogen-activated protein kinase organizer 1